MTPVCGHSVEVAPSVPPPLDGAPDGRAEAPVTPAAPTAPLPQFLCGHCAQPIDELVTGTWMRCPSCQHGVIIPGHVLATCTRCEHRHHVSTQLLASERLCATCGGELHVPDIVLAPRRRHRSHHHRHSSHHRRLDKRADAAWAVLIVGLTLLICLLSLIGV